MQKNKNNWTIKKIVFLFVVLCLVAKLVFDFTGFWSNFSYIFEFIGSLLSYLLTGFIIAYILNAYMHFWSSKLLKNVLKDKPRAKYVICLVIAYLTFLGILAFLIFTLVPTLYDTIKDLGDKSSQLIKDGEVLYNKLLAGDMFNIPDKVLKNIENALSHLTTTLLSLFDLKLITGILSNTTTWIFNFVMGVMVSVYMLIEKDNSVVAINRIMDGLLTKKSSYMLKWIFKEINKIFRLYFTGKLLEALICTILIYIAFTIAGIPYAILFAVIFGITNMIPYIGPWIGAIPVTLVSIVSDVWLGVAAVICILIIQAIDNWFIAPKIVGGKMGISPLLVLAGLSIGGKLFGVLGLLFGDVLAAIFKLFFYDVYIAKRIEAQKKKRMGISDEENEDTAYETEDTFEENSVSIDETINTVNDEIADKEKVSFVKRIFKKKNKI